MRLSSFVYDLAKSRCISCSSCFLFIFFTCIEIAPAQELNFQKTPITQHFTTNQYTGGIQNWDIGQNASGIIFVANSYGLLEFDGVEWRTHTLPNISRMLSMLVTKENIIYTGGQNQIGYFKPDVTGQMSYYSLLDLLPDKQINDVWKIILYDNKIFYGTNDAVYIYDHNKITKKTFPTDGGYIFKVASRLLAYSPTDGLLEWDNQQFKKIKNGSQFAKSSVIAILPYIGDEIMVFQSNGEIKILDNSGAISNWWNDKSDILKSAIINTAYLTTNNQLIIGTQNKGLLIFNQDGKSLLAIDKKTGLNSNTVLSIFEDNFNNLWVGLSNGISYVETGSPFSLINENLGVPGTGYAAALFKDTLYLGTNNGSFFIALKKRDMQGYQRVLNSEGQVYSIEKHGNRLFMGHHNGLYEIKGNRAHLVFGEMGTWRVRKIPESQNFIIGTYSGFYKANPDFHQVSYLSGLNESSRLFEFYHDSTILMSHGYKGVFKINIGQGESVGIKQVKHYTSNDGFPSMFLINMFKVANQYFFPAETGVYQLNPEIDRFELTEQITSLIGASSHVSAMAGNMTGDIYFISDNQFGLLKSDNYGNMQIISDPFKPINKYISDNLENITLINNENILIGAKEGFIHYNPTIIRPNAPDFKVFIRSIKIKNTTENSLYAGNLNSPPSIKLNKDVSSIQFGFATPYFDGLQGNVYRYKLDNFDQDWSEWSSTNQKEYTNLKYGDYQFKVEAKNIYGAISKPALVDFSIVPPWYRTNYAYAIYILILVSLFGFIIYWLDASHREDKLQMIKDQERVLEEKDLEIEEVAKMSQLTIEQLKNEKLNAEVSFKNKELVSATMHLLNKNEFMLNLISKLDALTKNGVPKSDEIKKIVKTIQKNIEEDANWEQFTLHFDQVHGDFIKKLKQQFPDLSPQDVKLAAYLRMNLTSKDIAQLLNITVRGVEISRYRLRKKLKLDRDINLVTFMMNL